MEKSEYHRYLASREWFLLKNKIIERSHGICERCKYGSVDHVHHLTYERIGQEKLEDLLGVCNNCHSFIHGKSDSDPLKKLDFDSGNDESNKVLEHLYGDEFLLLCPKCGYNYTHVRHVFAMSGSDQHEGGPDKNGLIYGIPPVMETSSRHNGLCIDVWCEQGHLFSLILQQHKGQTFVTSRHQKDIGYDEL